MRIDTVQTKLTEALSDLASTHCDILERDVNERTIGQCLAVLLAPHFGTFDVDCEYNLDVEDETLRKRVYGANGERARYATPDVIVHRRRKNGPENNILIVELKKHKNRVPQCDRDREKLCAYTVADGRNHLCFLCGALVIVGVANRAGEYEIEWFVNGRRYPEAGCCG